MKPVEVFPENETSAKSSTGVTVSWEDLYFPVGCGKFDGGARLNVPIIKVEVG